ncbi:hypothetical protein [Engelhardtia mirabilis]|uniref:DegT/DnrJ/EryC1/StrS aminotransferase family protein n=1 Tax=Engelhardtia mirabilis TaxID=2528011 RepID=A0A518BN98_9BACT|nr:hypothetical protein Pla133_35560 [Planctomycetes bacterium Pla133]QDV02784.1 hypothetical protein Pla86_35540 [Planctomycetes bacterium Pla86]
MNDEARKVIGGVFALESRGGAERSPAAGPFRDALAGRGRFLAASHARGALDWLVGFLEPARVWLPAYLCDALLSDRVRPRASFFDVDQDLVPSTGNWLDRLAPGDLVAPIAYFGWPIRGGLLGALRERGATIVVDASQALLTEGTQIGADYLLASPRKFVGVPDGGLLVPVEDAPWPDALPELIPWRAVTEALVAGRERREFDAAGGNGPERGWYAHFAAAESAAPTDARSCADDTAQRLAAVDWRAVAAARRANWEVLAAGLEGRLIFGQLPAEVVPMGCPVRFTSGPERDAARAALHAAAVYAPWHWDLEGAVPATHVAAHGLAARTLTLPLDQRYGAGDMARVLRTLEPVLARGAST